MQFVFIFGEVNISYIFNFIFRDLLTFSYFMYLLSVLLKQVNLCWTQSTHYMTQDCSFNYELITYKFQGQNMLCIKIGFWFWFWQSEQFMYKTCSKLGVFMYWTRNSMNNLLANYGLVDARTRPSEKDLPVIGSILNIFVRIKAK